MSDATSFLKGALGIGVGGSSSATAAAPAPTPAPAPAPSASEPSNHDAGAALRGMLGIGGGSSPAPSSSAAAASKKNDKQSGKKFGDNGKPNNTAAAGAGDGKKTGKARNSNHKSSRPKSRSKNTNGNAARQKNNHDGCDDELATLRSACPPHRLSDLDALVRGGYKPDMIQRIVSSWWDDGGASGVGDGGGDGDNDGEEEEWVSAGRGGTPKKVDKKKEKAAAEKNKAAEKGGKKKADAKAAKDKKKEPNRTKSTGKDRGNKSTGKDRGNKSTGKDRGNKSTGKDRPPKSATKPTSNHKGAANGGIGTASGGGGNKDKFFGGSAFQSSPDPSALPMPAFNSFIGGTTGGGKGHDSKTMLPSGATVSAEVMETVLVAEQEQEEEAKVEVEDTGSGGGGGVNLMAALNIGEDGNKTEVLAAPSERYPGQDLVCNLAVRVAEAAAPRPAGGTDGQRVPLASSGADAAAHAIADDAAADADDGWADGNGRTAADADDGGTDDATASAATAAGTATAGHDDDSGDASAARRAGPAVDHCRAAARDALQRSGAAPYRSGHDGSVCGAVDSRRWCWWCADGLAPTSSSSCCCSTAASAAAAAARPARSQGWLVGRQGRCQQINFSPIISCTTTSSAHLILNCLQNANRVRGFEFYYTPYYTAMPSFSAVALVHYSSFIHREHLASV